MEKLLAKVKDNNDPDKQRKVRVHLIGLTEGITETESFPWAYPLSADCIVPDVDDKVWVYVDKNPSEDYDYSNLCYYNYTEETYKEAYDYNNSDSRNIKNDNLDTSGTIQEPALPSSIVYPKNRVVKISKITVEYDEENKRFEITDESGNYIRLGQNEVVIKSTVPLYIMSQGNMFLKTDGDHQFKLETRSGNTFKSTDTGFTLDSGGSPEKMVLGETLKSWITGFINQQYGTHTHGSAMGPTSPPMVPASPPQETDMLSNKNKND